MNSNLLKSVGVAFIILFILIVSVNSFGSVKGQENSTIEEQSLPISDEDLLILNINLNRINTQLDIVLDKINKSDESLLFEHSFIPHSVIFPTIKNLTTSLDADFAKSLEILLTDIPFQIKSNQDPLLAKQEIIDAKNITITFYSKIKDALSKQEYFILESQTLNYLLKDSELSYGIFLNSSIDSNNNSVNNDLVDYENALGLVNQSNFIFNFLKADMDDSKAKEITFFITSSNALISSKSDNVKEYSILVDAIERDLNEFNNIVIPESNTINNSHQTYFNTIENLLNSAILKIKNANDYQSADKIVSSAYLDNYEYLEAPIEKVNSTLMAEIEIDLRENLRDLINQQYPLTEIENLVSKIKNNLEISMNLLVSENNIPSTNTINSTISSSSFVPNVANIDSLKQGFGIYTGERRNMGDTSDTFKDQVRSDIDNIRIKLDEIIKYYSQNDVSQALSSTQSAYLDSYENIEKPLRPIDPDFTLEMEIKFAELRNLISSQSPLEQVVSKITEIKSGLDESERLVSGTGVLAPTIAFSSSFSIIFREGLESALILGAILTYLEASRNDRFKKHVYLGIVFAIALTALTWFVAEFLIDISGASKAMIEAIAGISAVAVLFWVSFWILNKIETKKWIEFVKAKVWQATATGSFMVFVLLSFFTVYREGFETILFYQALFSFAKYMELYVLTGLVIGLTVIIGVVFIIRKLGKKLPLKVLFGFTMGVGAFMSITFMGNAIREFQELGYISTTHLLGIIPRFDINIATMTGIHPTLETIVAQVILLSIYLIGSIYILIIQPRKQQIIAATRKSMGDGNKGKFS
jgi:high-affinity iron transporter